MENAQAATFVASDEQHIPLHLVLGSSPGVVHVAPASSDLYIDPDIAPSTAKILVPSAEQQMPYQSTGNVAASSFQVSPPSTDAHMRLMDATAVMRRPSAEQHMPRQLRDPAIVLPTHVAPPSVEVYMYPPNTAAAMVHPSDEQHMPRQLRDPAVVRCIHSGVTDMT